MSDEGGQGGFGGFNLGNLGNLGDLFQRATKLQERWQELQAELAKKRIEGVSGGGMVVAIVNGKSELCGLRIEKAVVDPADVEMLQDLIVAAVNDATRKSREAMQEEVSKLTGGIRIPGLFGGP